MILALAGAVTMLWRPELDLPWPETRAEWLGVVAGFLFALGNVLVRRIDNMTDAGKSIVIWMGVTVAAMAHLPWSGTRAEYAFELAWTQVWLIGGVAVALVAMSLAMQYGLSRIPANRAIVLLLIELPIAAVAAWLLSGEEPRVQDYLGGALIIAATLTSAFFEKK